MPKQPASVAHHQNGDDGAGFCYDPFIKNSPITTINQGEQDGEQAVGQNIEQTRERVMEFILKNKTDIDVLADTVLKMVMDNGEEEGSVIITLQGELGSGKTTFTKAFAQKLGITESITSPTFVILKKYKIPEIKQPGIKIPFDNLIHIDAYRLENSDELKKIGFEKQKQERNIICIEWPEIVEDLLPKKRISIKFEHTLGETDIVSTGDSDLRKVTVEQKV